MPFYDYRCQKCGDVQEKFVQTYSEAPASMKCEACQEGIMTKCLSAPTVRFGGNGYYETDEKPKNKQRFIAEGCSTPAGCGKGACGTTD